MVTEKQLVANRENAKKGGPKTEAGKDIVRLNALQHGLLCKEVLLRGEKQAALNELRAQLITKFQPQGALEEVLVERIVSSLWRLKRAIRVETQFIQAEINYCGLDFVVDEARSWNKVVTEQLGEGKGWLNLMRYETTIERQMYKAMHELERLQMARLGAIVPAPLAVDVDVSKDG